MDGAESDGSCASGDQRGTLSCLPNPQHSNYNIRSSVSPFRPGKLADRASSAPTPESEVPNLDTKASSSVTLGPRLQPKQLRKASQLLGRSRLWSLMGQALNPWLWAPLAFPFLVLSFFLHSSLAETGNRQSHNTCSPQFLSLALWCDLRGA